MSNDLISRNAVVAIIEKNRLLVGKHDLSAEYKLAGVQEEIENLPTAYDVDKVVEQLEERMCSVEDEATDIGCYMRNLHFRDAIEVVKSGGISKE